MANPVYVTLVADTDTPTTLDGNYGRVEVTLVSGAATTYVNAFGVAIGAVSGTQDGNHVLTAGLTSKTIPSKTGGAATVVHLRSAGTPTVGLYGL